MARRRAPAAAEMEEEDDDDSGSGSGSGSGSSIVGVGRPVLGYRNWEGYGAARDGPDTRLRDRRGAGARAQAELLQRWRPDLMLDRDSLEGVLREERADGRARRLEGMQFQGNALWAPPVAPVTLKTTPRGHDEVATTTMTTVRRRLLVHAAGPILDRLHLSWANEERPTAHHRAAVPSCWMSGGRWCSGEVGTVRQLAALNQYEEFGSDAASPFLSEPPTCFARGTTEAALFQLQPLEEEEEPEVLGDDGADSVPFYVSPIQKLQFPHRLLDVATRPASVDRAAFLTEGLGVYEWSSAVGASRVGLELPAAAARKMESAASLSEPWPAGHQARLAWAAHPRCLWLSSNGALCRLDLRQRVASAFPIDPPTWPLDLLASAAGDGANGGGASSSSSSRGAGAFLRSTAALTAVGPVERHPLDENILFVAADHCLLALDLRQPRQPLSILPQAEPTHLLALGVFGPSSSSSSSSASTQQGSNPPRTWIATGGRTLPRLHLHLETDGSLRRRRRSNHSLGLVEEWLARGAGDDGGGRPRPVGYETATFVNWDSTPARGQPVWLAGLGVLPPLPWAEGGSGSGSGGSGSGGGSSALLLPYATSLGDVYLQRVLCQAHPEGDGEKEGEGASSLPAGLRRVRPGALPCGVTAHVMEEEEEEPAPTTTTAPLPPPGAGAAAAAPGPLPSSAFLQAWDADSLRDHRAVAVDPPARLFGSLLPAGLEAPPGSSSAAAASSNRGVKAKEEDEGGEEGGHGPSFAALSATMAAAVARAREGLRPLLSSHPRSLLEVAAELERLEPGAVSLAAPNVEDSLRALHAALLLEEAREDGRQGLLVRAQAGEAAAGARASAVRPEEPRRTDLAAARAEEEEVVVDGGSSLTKMCRCDGGSSPCGAPSCLQPSRVLYWGAGSKALAPSTTTTAAAAPAGLGAAAAAMVHGLDDDILQHLRGQWYAQR